MRLNLTNNKEDRQLVLAKEQEGKINLVNLLKKYGDVVDYMTEPMVAEFYGIPGNTLQKIGTRNKTELEQYGYKAYKKSEVEKLLKVQDVLLENIPNRGLRLYPIKAVIVVGMMLTDSPVAEQLRRDIMDILFGNEVAIPTESTIRNVVSTELDKRVPQLVGCKDSQVKAIVKAVKGNLRIKNKKQNYADYETVMAWLLGKYGVYKLEDIPFSDDLFVDIKNFIIKLQAVDNRQKRLF
jgi:hypothetical protein